MTTRRSGPALLIDADACPVTGIALDLARRYRVPVMLVCDTAHAMVRPGAETVTVDKGADSADFALVNRIRPGDIVVTGDYGLAAMALARGGVCLNHDGQPYTADNIDSLLASRHTAAKIRRGGGRLRGPKARTPQQDEAFAASLEAQLRQAGEQL